MTTFTNVPKEVEELLEEGNTTISRRTFLRGSGLLVVSVGAAAIANANPLGPAAGAGAAAMAQGAGPYPDPDFRQLDSWIVIHENSTATFYVGKDRLRPGHGNGPATDDVR
jgi:hypothetical protein